LTDVRAPKKSAFTIVSGFVISIMEERKFTEPESTLLLSSASSYAAPAESIADFDS